MSSSPGNLEGIGQILRFDNNYRLCYTNSIEITHTHRKVLIMKRKLITLAVLLSIASTSQAGLFGPSKEELRMQELQLQNQKMREEIDLRTAEAGKVNPYEPVTSQAITQVNIPSWYVMPPKASEQSVFVAGTATSSTLSMATQKAIMDADTKLAFQMESAVKAMIKTYQNDLGTDIVENTELVARKVSAVTVNGHHQVDMQVTQEGRVYRVFVLMRFPLGGANYFAEQIRKDSVKNQSVARERAATTELNDSVANKQAKTAAQQEMEQATLSQPVLESRQAEPLKPLERIETDGNGVIINRVVEEAAAFKPASQVDLSKLPHNDISDQKLRAEIDAILAKPNAVVMTTTVQ
jgi:hypothetical protein